MSSLTVVNTRPGLIRAGRSHPAVAVHKPGTFTPAELMEMVTEPAFTLVLGKPLSEADVQQLLDAAVADAELVAAEITANEVRLTNMALGELERASAATKAAGKGAKA